MQKVIYFVIILFLSSCFEKSNIKAQEKEKNMNFEVQKTEEEWKKTLSEEEYRVLREKGTERAYTGKYDNFFENGIYKCAGCGTVIFDSETKYNSHCGWPAFYDAKDTTKVKFIDDKSHGMSRTEVVCAKCGGHLGHVFEDGPKPTGLRYCINSVSLEFEKTTKKD